MLVQLLPLLLVARKIWHLYFFDCLAFVPSWLIFIVLGNAFFSSIPNLISIIGDLDSVTHRPNPAGHATSTAFFKLWSPPVNALTAPFFDTTLPF